MTRVVPLPAVLTLACLALAGCATPQQRCMRPLVDDLETVQYLIGETEAALARGYTYRVEPSPWNVGLNFCVGGYNTGAGVAFCNDNYNDYVEVPVAIDSVSERRKLDELRAREAALQAAIPKAEAACALRYPG